MAFRIILITALMASVAMAQDIDFDVLLNNKAYIDTQLKCIKKTDPKVCDRIGLRLRDELLPDAAKTGECTICTPKEKTYLGKAAQLIKTKFAADWAILLDVYKVPQEIRPKLLDKEIRALTP